VPALPVLAELFQRGIERVSHPRPSLSGALHEPLGEDVLVVYDYFDALRVDVTSIDTEPVGELIGRVHALRGINATEERFEPPYAVELWPTLAMARDTVPRNPAEAHLQGFLNRQWEALGEEWRSFQQIGQRCRAAVSNFVITHGDWPFNVLRDKAGELYLVDWDELLLAPAERDLWFPQRDAAFMSGYQRQRPDYVENELATAYYVASRYFEDLFWSARAVLTGTVPAHHSPLTFFENPWMNDMRARMTDFRRR
jgi:spectinomycin phosphotransferase